jgi:hypothetical protein
VVEEGLGVGRFETGERFGEWYGHVVAGMIFEEMTTVHFCAGLEDYEFEGGTEVVYSDRGTAEHGFCVCIFLGEIGGGFVCCKVSVILLSRIKEAQRGGPR